MPDLENASREHIEAWLRDMRERGNKPASGRSRQVLCLLLRRVLPPRRIKVRRQIAQLDGVRGTHVQAAAKLQAPGARYAALFFVA